MHTSYDRYSGLKMDVKLNRIAAARLKEAMENGMQMGKTALIRSFIYEIVRMGKLLLINHGCAGKQYSRGEAYQDTLDYYRYLGMAHYEADGRHWFMVVLKR